MITEFNTCYLHPQVYCPCSVDSIYFSVDFHSEMQLLVCVKSIKT